MQLQEAIQTRHSTRQFLPAEVPISILESALQLATHSPSNSNTQPWRLFIVRGAALTRLSEKLHERASTALSANEAPARAMTLPPGLQHYRSELGAQIYGVEGLGILRSDTAGHAGAVLRNYRFFGAPAAFIVCVRRDLLDAVEAAPLCVGMYLQTLLLALTEAGVASCVQIAIAAYPDVVRAEVGIPADLEVLCGVSVGYEDQAAKINHCRIGREAVGKTTVWVDE
ncbi:hypothetical protein MGN70_003314 [Eutypa lata]|nr:hypothetical protein MGN70_003314 [Eutypa lata]